jgi:osmotically-inducible protein OsmY
MIQVGVSDGWVTLSGQVEWHYQKAAAETTLHRVQGVKGIRNDVVVLPPDEITDIKARIERALRRVAEVEAERIDVSVIGQTVVLDGEVGSWVERDAVNDAARATPGVSIVDDRLRVSDLR